MVFSVRVRFLGAERFLDRKAACAGALSKERCGEDRITQSVDQ